jgi:hypothetical protein
MPLASFPLEGTDGATVVVEVDESTSPNTLTRCSPGADGILRVSQTFDQSLESIKTIANRTIAALKGLDFEGGELSLGFKLTAAAGVVLAKAGAEAQIGVKLTWKKPAAK